MEIAATKLCPACAKPISSRAPACIHCGKDLIGNVHWIVPDGFQYGISIKGKVVLHGLTLEKARNLAALMDQVDKGVGDIEESA